MLLKTYRNTLSRIRSAACVRRINVVHNYFDIIFYTYQDYRDTCIGDGLVLRQKFTNQYDYFINAANVDICEI